MSGPVETQLEFAFDGGLDTVQLGALGHDVHRALQEALPASSPPRPTEEIARAVALRLWAEGWRLV